MLHNSVELMKMKMMTVSQLAVTLYDQCQGLCAVCLQLQTCTPYLHTRRCRANRCFRREVGGAADTNS